VKKDAPDNVVSCLPASDVPFVNLESMYPRLIITDVNSGMRQDGSVKEASWRLLAADTADCGVDTEYAGNTGDRHSVAAF